MPRINIEQKWWSDPRRMMLTIKLGAIMADGVFLNAIKLSQDHNGLPFDPKGLLLDEWVEALIDVGLAKKTPEGLVVSGSEKYHSWLLSQREKSKKGGEATKRKINSLKGPTTRPTTRPSGRPTTRPTGGPSSSSSSSLEQAKPNGFGELVVSKNENPPAVAELQKQPIKNKVGYFVGCYAKSFQARYNTRPDLSGKRQGQIKNLVAGAEDFDELCDLIQVYCQSNDTWFCKKMHDIQTFAENIGKVRVLMNNALDTKDFEAKKQKEDFWANVKLP